jgi:hypothetical protein
MMSQPKEGSALLNQAEVERQFGIPPSNLRTWSMDGCPGLAGRKVRVRVEDGAALFERGHMKTVSRFPRPSPEYRDERGRHYLTRVEAARRYGFSTAVLAYWTRKQCVWIGRALSFRSVLTYDPQPRGGFQRMHYLSVEDLDAIRTAQSRADGGAWIGIRKREALRLLGLGRKGLGRAARIAQPALGGRAVRCEKRPHRRPDGQVRNVLHYSMEDLQTLRQWRKNLDPEAVGLRAEEAAALLGVDPSVLHLWRRQGCRHLPGRRSLRATQVRYERRTQRGTDKVWRYDRADIDAIAKVVHSSSPQTFEGPSGRDLTAREVARAFPGITVLRLNKWRRLNRCPQLPVPFDRACKTIPAPTGRGACKRKEIWVYSHSHLSSIYTALMQANPAEAMAPANIAGGGTMPTGTEAMGRSAAFIPTQFQERLLRTLTLKALTADLLQTRLRADRKQLYRDGLRPLMASGLVKNNRRVGGYYRPDSPPPGFAEKLNG